MAGQKLIRAENIDQLLGPNSERYFGSGYRTVEQHIHDLVIRDGGEHGSSIDALIDIRSNAHGELRQKFASHLSSIDVIVTSTSLARALIAHATRDADCARMASLESISVRAGANADTKMSGIPARIVLSAHEHHSGIGRGKFNTTVGTMKVIITVIWKGPPWRSNRKPTITHLAALAELLGNQCGNPRGVMPQVRSLAIRDVEVDLDARLASCNVVSTRSVAAQSENSSMPIVEGLVVTAQLAQVLLFAMAGTTRCAAGNLWMRRAAFSAEVPGVLATSPFKVTMMVSRSTFLERGARAWLVADVVISNFPGVHGAASLAFAMPT